MSWIPEAAVGLLVGFFMAAIATEVNTEIAPQYDVIAPLLGCK